MSTQHIIMQQNEYFLEATHKTPEIKGNIKDGKFTISGKSIPEDARDFYFPFRNWVLEFIQTENPDINVTVELEYFNTSTSSIILDIFKHLLKASEQKSVKITWLYDEDDLDIEEAGEDYKLMIGDIITLQPRKPDY